MAKLHTAHTSSLTAETLQTARHLLHEVFEGDWTDHDWDHALGGIHALIWEDDTLIAHASVVQRRLLHAGRALRTGYVEGVGVHKDHRGHGHGATLMDAIERVIRDAYELGALSSSEEAVTFYAKRGWKAWQGPTSAITPQGTIRTADEDGGVFVLPSGAPLDLTGELACDWRDGELW